MALHILYSYAWIAKNSCQRTRDEVVVRSCFGRLEKPLLGWTLLNTSTTSVSNASTKSISLLVNNISSKLHSCTHAMIHKPNYQPLQLHCNAIPSTPHTSSAASSRTQHSNMAQPSNFPLPLIQPVGTPPPISPLTLTPSQRYFQTLSNPPSAII
jgi:hypothetical protein